jgi:alkanesulfonate monooxygenase SsuD/methylene tetrahydromethanopterin reductase-like flavin-dependent oxidoreductase (luciferase family)
MEPDLDATVLKNWARAIDEGPFSSLCWGERIAFDNPDSLTLLGALSAWTERVRLVTTVIVPQLHDPTMLAKALATGDVLSEGRLTVGIGIGGRHEDYHAVGADLSTQTRRGLAERVAVMKRIWAGEKLTDSVLPVGPKPVQPGGPPLLIGSIGPKTIRDAAAWSDGVSGAALDLDTVKENELFGVGGGRQAEAALGDVVLVRVRAAATGPRTGPSASAPLHELDTGRVRRRDGADDRVGRHRRRTRGGAAEVPRDRHRRNSAHPNQFRPRSGAPSRRRDRQLLEGR